MLKTIRDRINQGRQRRRLKAYKHEAFMNLETWHVIHQLKRLRPLHSALIKERKRLGWVESNLILPYEEFVLSYQDMYADYHKYEQHYKMNGSFRTKTTARKLHEKREAVFDKWRCGRKVLEQVQEIC